MKKLFYLAVLATILFGCNKQSKITGPINVPGSLFTYTAEGNGIPCVIFTGSENVGHRMLPEELQEYFIFIHADPGNIKSEIISDITLDDILDDLEKLRSTLGVGKIAILGHSMFGLLPFEYAVKYPDNISYAISTGSVPCTTDKTVQAQREYWKNEASQERKNIRKKNWEELRQLDISSLSPTQQFVKRYTADTPYRFCDPDFDMSAWWEGITINMDFLSHYGGVLMNDFDHTTNYKNIKSPVLVLSGKCDFGAPYYLWEDVKSSNVIPDLTLIVYENAGHNPFYEIPDEFAKDVLEWIESNR